MSSTWVYFVFLSVGWLFRCILTRFLSSQRAAVCEPAEQTSGPRHRESHPGHQLEG